VSSQHAFVSRTGATPITRPTILYNTEPIIGSAEPAENEPTVGSNRNDNNIESEEPAKIINDPPLSSSSRSSSSSSSSAFDSFLEGAAARLKIVQDSKAAGYSNKQTIADLFAGEYDEDTVRANVIELSKSAPCVIFVWQNSPSCKKAIEKFDMMGVQYKLVGLDDPWDEGNKMRAQLGRMTSKTSVPSIWIGGEYVGGFDSGAPDNDNESSSSPGIVDLAFMGKLRPRLEAAGALEK